MRFKTVYYDGDSHSMYKVSKNTGNFVAEYYNSELIHKGSPGKSPSEIINHFLNSNHDLNTLYLIGFGVELRDIDIVNNNMVRMRESELLIGSPQRYSYELMVKLCMLSGFCKSKNLKFLIHNLDYMPFDNLWNLPFCNNIVTQIKMDPNIVGFLDDQSLHHLMKINNLPGLDFNEYGDVAHPTEEGHNMYAEFLINKINELY